MKTLCQFDKINSMKRFGICLLLLLLLFTPATIAFAQSPPPAEEPPPINLDETPPPAEKTRDQLLLGATPAPPSDGKLKPIYKGMTSLAVTGFGTGESFLLNGAIKIGFTLEDIVKPWFQEKEKKIGTPDFLPHATLNQNIVPYLTSQNVLDKIVHYSEDNANTLTSRFCAIQTNKTSTVGDKREDVESKGNQESSNVENSQPLFENARLVNTAVGLQFIEPTTVGNYDMNLASEIMGGGSVMGFCDVNFNGLSVNPLENTVRRFSTFGTDGPGVVIISDLISIIDWIINAAGNLIPQYEKDTAALGVRLTEVSHDSNFHQLANIGDVDLNDIQSAKAFKKAPYDWTRMLAKTRGWAFNYLPEKQADVKPTPAATTDYAYTVFGIEPDGGNAFANKSGGISHPWPFLNTAAQREKEAACIVSPDILQSGLAFGTKDDKIAIGDACPEKHIKCPIDFIAEENPPSKDSSCGLCNTGSYTSSGDFLTDLEKKAFPNGVPPLLVKVLKYVGSVYHVPPAALLGTMLEEGSFEHAPTWTWTDETVKQYSDCTIKDPIPSCGEFANPGTGAKGPFGYIQNWWDNYMSKGGPYQGVENDAAWKDVLGNRPKDTISQCNFLDAAFMAARELGQDQSHLYVPGIPTQCTVAESGIDTPVYQGGDIPGSCSAWKSDRVALSRLQYGDRVCDGSVGRMVKTFNAFACGQ